MNSSLLRLKSVGRGEKGSVLVSVLWCLAILSVVIIGGLHTARLDLIITKNQSDQIRAYYLAVAGAEKAKALLFHELKQNRQAGSETSTTLLNNETHFKDQELGGGQFRVIRGPNANETGPLVYGVSDESSRLNINHASIESLAKLPGMDASLAARIVDYRDNDSQVSPDGAEEESYITLNPPRLPLNAPIADTWEILGVAGMTREIFMGEDFNLNSMLDPDEDNGELTSPMDNNDGILNGGISTLVTHATVSSLVDARGEARVNVQSASESELQLLDGINQDIAKAIVAYREQNEFSSIADLLEVRAMQSDGNNNNNNNSSNRSRRGASGNRGGQSRNNNGGSSSPTGSPLISKEMLIQIADKIMVGTETTAPGAVNLNTAPREVLICLPGLEETGADAIIRYRQSNGNFKNTAEILNIPEITTEIFKQLAPVTCARSETYRIFSEGKFGRSGAIKRIQLIVRIGESTVETLSYKEDL